MKVVSLTQAQERIWLECQLNPQSIAYNNPLLYVLRGPLEVDCLQKALQHVVAMQPGLRSYFITQAGVPKQVIRARCDMKVLQFDDISSLKKEEQALGLQQWIIEHAHCQFQLTDLPLFRFSLLKLGADDYRLLLNIHHIVVDGYSAHLLIESISTYYQQFLIGESVEVNPFDQVYADYCETSEQEEVSPEAITFWQEQFEDANIRVDLFRSESSTFSADAGQRDYFSITSELSQQLKQLAKQYKTTDFTLLMSAFYIVLGYYANQDDMVIGYPLDIRPHACREIFGFFVNNIPLRVRLNLNQGLGALIQQLNQTRKKIKPYQKTDLKNIIRYVRAHYPSYPDSLYNVSFVRANFAKSGLRLTGIDVEAQLISTDAVKDELCLLFDENQETKAFEFAIEYKKQCYAADFIQHLRAAYVACLQALLDTPEKPIKDLSFYVHLPQPVLGGGEPVEDDFIDRFVKHVTQTPEKNALISSTTSVSYQALYEDVNDWCQRLFPLAEQAKPVIVCINRCPTLVSLLLALQWLEITYIPVDINTPLERLRVIIDDSGAGACIYDDEEMKLSDSCLFLSLSALKNKPLKNEDSTASLLRARVTRNPIAYVIYTSGSTGIPKGVEVSRLALNNFLYGLAKYFMQEENSLFLAITTIAFDIAGLELFLPIWQGRTLLLANQAQHKDPFQIAALARQYPVTHLQATPAMWQMLNNIGWEGKLGLVALTGGEALFKSLAHDLLGKVSQLWNMYGPTEATIWCALKRVDNENAITVGRPIANMNMRVLNAEHRILPPFVKGELYIGGVGLAEGYVNRPELTEKQFIKLAQERLYRVGDIACTDNKGEFILFGRTDNQIKLNGYRIELGEIESRIQDIEEVSDCAVIVAHHQLIAYISLKKGRVLSESALFSALENILPEYMIPKQCLFLDALPLTVSGKLDRKALPVQSIRSEENVQPSDPIEAKLLDLWQAVLLKKPKSVTDHFYRLGGHSLLVSQLVVQINAHFKRSFSMAEIFNHLTIRKQAELIRHSTSESLSFVIETNAKKAPFTAAQRRIWFTSQLMPNEATYHMAAQLTIRGDLDIVKLGRAIELLADRHEALRAVIEIQGGEPWQCIQEKSTVQLEYLDTFSEALSTDWVARPFKANDVWWRIALHSTEDEHKILVCIHHAIADGYSVSLFLKELFAFYQGKNLPLMTHRYLDCVTFELSKQESVGHLSFWHTELLENAYLELPFDRHDDGLRSAHMMQVIEADTWRTIRQYCAARQVSISTVLIAAFGWLMHQWSKQSDFCIGVPIAKRENQALHDKFGCFMDILPLRLLINKQHTFFEWINHVQKQFANGLSHFVPFSSLLSQLQLERHDAFSPLFPVVINIQPYPFEDILVDGAVVQTQPLYVDSLKYPLSLDIYFSDEKAECRWEYAAEKFKHETISSLINQFHVLLSDVVSMSDQMMKGQKIKVSSKKITTIAFGRNIYRSPESLLQQNIALIWQTVLGVPEIGLDDHFFRLGGHSFVAAQMISDLTDLLTEAIPMDLVFRFPVLVDFCAAIEALPKEEITPVFDDHAPLLLTPNQHQMVLALKEKPDETYHVSALITRAFWDVEYLETLLNELITQHSVYRLYLTTSMTLAETIHVSHISVPVFQLDSSISLLDWAKLKNQTPIDLFQAPLLRVCVAKGVGEEGVLITLHHLIADEWALQMFTTALLERYEGNSKPWICSSWRNHAPVWLNPNPESVQYWRQYLNTFQPSVIPPSCQRLSQGVQHVSLHIPPTIVRDCERLAQGRGGTLFHLMLSVFVYFVRQFSSENTVAIAVTYDRRHNKVLQNLQGYLVNLLPLVCEIDTLKTWDTLLEFVKKDHLCALEASNVDYAYLLAQGLVSAPSIVFNYQHEVAGLHQNLDWHEVGNQQARFPITLHLRKMGGGEMSAVIEYESSDYDIDFITSMLTAFVDLIQRLPQQHQCALNYWSFSVHNSAVSTLKLDVMNFLKYPGMDIYYQGMTRTRDSLWQDVSKFAYVLRMYEHLKPGEVVGLALSDRYSYIVSLLAVLYVGGAFLPIDVNLPIERQEFIIKDSHALWVVDDEHFKAWMTRPAEVIDTIIVDDALPAYIIYTSGTTGLPKGTCVSRCALQSFISGLQHQLQLEESDSILQFSSTSFDASIWEIFLALISGARLIIPDESERRAGAALTQFIKEQGITHAILTPTVLNTLSPDAIPSLRVVASGGEPCTAHLIAQWAGRCDFYNAYGPTEATVCVALARLTSQSLPNCIGKALGLAELRVVSPALLPVPAGVIGELLIGGPILAENYINQPELSKKQFILLEGQRWYRSGDKVRQTVAGEFEYIGREDSQIKLRGLRIELCEIDATICSLPSISSACCVLQDEQLIAYVTMDEVLNETETLAQLAKILPHYMIPARMIQMDVFPLLPSGKINTKAFPPVLKQETLRVEPRNSQERAILEIWSKHLNRIDLDIHQDFFRLGGNSLQAMGIATDLEKHFSVNISLQFFYTYGTIAKQSEYMIEQEGAEKEIDDWLSQLSEAEKQELLESLSL